MGQIFVDLKKTIQEIAGQRLVNMVFYGSGTRGDYSEGSDTGIAIIVRGFSPERISRPSRKTPKSWPPPSKNKVHPVVALLPVIHKFSTTTKMQGFKRVINFTEAFIIDKTKPSQWKAFLRKNRMVGPDTFEEAIYAVSLFLKPIVESLVNNQTVPATWKAPGPWHR